MNTYIIDCGEKCNGSRYALISAIDSFHLMDEIDVVKDPSFIKFCNLSVWLFESEHENYLELGNGENSYGYTLENLAEQLPWKNITDLD